MLGLSTELRVTNGKKDSAKNYATKMGRIPALKPEMKQILLSTFANALKISQNKLDRYKSFNNIHVACERAHPNQLLTYTNFIILLKFTIHIHPKWI